MSFQLPARLVLCAFGVAFAFPLSADVLPGSVPAGGLKLPGPINITESTAEDNNEYNFQIPLAQTVVAGDLILCEDPNQVCDKAHPGNWSDVLRFAADPAHPGKSIAVFYSEPTFGTPQEFFTFIQIVNPKDPFSGPISANAVFRYETNGGTDQTGGIFLYSSGKNSYAIVSDPAPEPAAWILLGTLLCLMAAMAYRRRT